MPACVHPVADQRIQSLARTVVTHGVHVVSVTLRCAECGEETTLTKKPRTDRPGTDASTEQSENVHAEQ